MEQFSASSLSGVQAQNKHLELKLQQLDNEYIKLQQTLADQQRLLSEEVKRYEKQWSEYSKQ